MQMQGAWGVSPLRALVINIFEGVTYYNWKFDRKYLPHVKPGLLQPPVLQVRIFCCATVSGPSNSLNPVSQVWVATLPIFRTTLLNSSEYLTVPLKRVSSGQTVRVCVCVCVCVFVYVNKRERTQ